MGPPRVLGPFWRTAYDVRAAYRSGVEYEWGLIAPPLLTQLTGWGEKGVTQASYLVAVPDCMDGSVWRRSIGGPGWVTGPDDEDSILMINLYRTSSSLLQ